MNKVPYFASQGEVVWVLYNFLRCFWPSAQPVQKKLATHLTTRDSTKSGILGRGSTLDYTHFDRAEAEFNFQFCNIVL